MKTLKQLARQPIKSLSRLLLITLAVAVLCTCVGQAWAAKITAENLDHQFSTIALPTASHNYLWATLSLPEDLMEWLSEMEETHPDIVKDVAQHRFLSAYVPEMTPLNATQEDWIGLVRTTGNYHYYGYVPAPNGRPYCSAMLVITLEEISEPRENTISYTVEEKRSLEDFLTAEEYLAWNNSVGKETVTDSFSVKLKGTITDVVSLAEGYRNPVGMFARLTLTVPTLEALEQFDLEVGQQYIVYGMDYYDQDWALHGWYSYEGHENPKDLGEYDPSSLRMLTEEDIQRYKENGNYRQQVAYYKGLTLTQYELNQLNTITMSLEMPLSMIKYEEIREGENGKLLQLLPKTTVTYTDASGQEITLTNEEYTQRYSIPTIAKLSGSVEDFLSSEDGAAWLTALEYDAVNHQSFLTLGVDKLSYLTNFANGKSRVVAGRDFTAEELASGARVCIIQENLAAANGLKIGDTITANFYHTDYGLPYQVISDNVLTPSATFYFGDDFAEMAEYTIVGFWRDLDLWPDVAFNEYAFTPNTIFVPQTSVQTAMEHSNSILFTTPIIQNGKLEDFKILVNQAGFAGRFISFDQGYATIAKNFHNYEELGKRVLLAGAAIYVILLGLYLLLYPGMQKKTVRTMESLGMPFGKRFEYVMVVSLVIFVPATVIGVLLGTILWDKVVAALQASAEAATALQLPLSALVIVGIAQFVLALVLNAILALVIAAPRRMSRQ